MNLKNYFIKATEEFNTFENNVPAYYFRRAFASDSAQKARITVAVCGIYEIFFNGERITRGFLSPYFSNTDHYIYCDEYDVTLREGENVVGIWLGNGFQNNPGGHIWDFDKSPFRSAPMFSLSVTQDEKIIMHTDKSFKIAASPLLFDDYRFGEYYDATKEIGGWCDIGFDDSGWDSALGATAPNGELRIADVAPIVKECEIKPVSITRLDDGYIYDFGQSNAGVCRLRIKGESGQKVVMRHADSLTDDGELNIEQIWMKRAQWERDKEMVHRDVYVCKGDGVETYQPTFTYHGFRYVKVEGIAEAQATEELLTYLVYHTELSTMGDFSCSDVTAQKLQELTRRSIVSNFHHFPTDCPQREKNGWTADAALSAEAALINFDPERNYREWMRNICKAQRADGALPGIVPTGGWGFEGSNGPAWDCVLAWIPYFTYIYRGETAMIEESADTFIKYLRYARTRCNENGLLAIGLGDWCHVGGIKHKAPRIVTDSITSMATANMMAFMLDAIGRRDDAEYARGEAKKYREAIRANLVDFDTMLVSGECQTSQAMAIYYGVFDESEQGAAFEKLLAIIHGADDHIDIGVLGGRVIFHVLTKFGYSDLAFKMITREDFPSYGNWIARGATTLWENFLPTRVSSMNHHFWGDISAWFVKRIVGINLNPNLCNVNELEISPSFIASLDHASAYHIAPAGKVAVSWRREDSGIILEIKIPDGISANLKLERGYRLDGEINTDPLASGTYRVKRV